MKAEAWETITVPAGQFKALRFVNAIRFVNSDFGRTGSARQETVWFAPEVGRWVVRDWYAFTLSFKGVFLEGLEVAFIVVTFGNNQRDVPLAALGALTAVLAVTAVGFAVRAPLAKVPENTLKFAVGTMLTSFGLFWSTEGTGAHWPGTDAALLAIVPAVALLALTCTALLRRTAAAAAASPTPVEGVLR